MLENYQSFKSIIEFQENRLLETYLIEFQRNSGLVEHDYFTLLARNKNAAIKEDSLKYWQHKFQDVDIREVEKKYQQIDFLELKYEQRKKKEKTQ